jgi:hypothetical protein
MGLPVMVVAKQLPGGTPVRAACPLCDTEFSTEAFEEDAAYPHREKRPRRCWRLAQPLLRLRGA